jgi:hypothetical protein
MNHSPHITNIKDRKSGKGGYLPALRIRLGVHSMLCVKGIVSQDSVLTETMVI